MSVLGKLLKAWTVEKTVSLTAPLFLRLVTAVAVAVLLIALAGIFLMLLIAGVLGIGYLDLVARGLDPQSALTVLGVIVLALLVAVGFGVYHYIQKIHGLYIYVYQGHMPIAGRVAHILDAFFQGLLLKRR